MSEELVKKVQEMLKEETWTRAAISNYTTNNLIELETIVEQTINEDRIDEIKEICDEQLSHSKDSIIALYISGMLAIKKGTLDYSSLETLVDIFQKNHKDNIVTWLCEKITEKSPTNKFALRTLAKQYAEKQNEDVWKIYETLAKVDFEDAETAKILAVHYEEEDKLDDAKDYYKKALLRFVNAKNYNAVKEVWGKLLTLIPEEIEFFMMVQRKICCNRICQCAFIFSKQ